MYGISAALTVFIGVCAARVPLSGRVSSNSSGQARGLPLGNLPTLNATTNVSGNLELPVGPWVFLGFRTAFTLEPAQGAPAHRIYFEGGELISSIFSQIIKVWKDTADAPIVYEIETRDGPFSIWHTIQPGLAAGAAALTPVKVGVTYCLMILQVLQAENWPGHIIANLYNEGPGGPHMGTIDIKDQLANTPVSSNYTPGSIANLTADQVSIITSSNNTQPQISLLQTRAERERAWLKAFSRLSLYVLRQPPLQHVLDTIQPFPPHDFWPITFTMGAECEITLTVSRYAGDVTWESVAEAMMDLIVSATMADAWDFSEQVALRNEDDVDIIMISLRSYRDAAAS